jgi:hypothetical protein
VQHEGVVRLHLDQVREIGLLLGGIDDRVLVVVEEPEEPVDAHIDTRRLNHRRLEGVDPHPPRVDLRADVTVAEQHRNKVARERPEQADTPGSTGYGDD